MRTYACNESGSRTIKYFSYHYDFEEDKCVEKVKRVVNRCEAIREENENSDRNEDRNEDRNSDDNEDDRDRNEQKHVSNRKTRSTKHHGKFTRADDFNDKTLGMH